MALKLLAVLLGLLSLAGCQAVSGEQNNWLYQLQFADPEKISNSNYEMVVIDPTRNGRDSTRYTEEEISSIQDNGTKVLAYLSIGEASAFKSYWEEDWGEEQDGTLVVTDQAPDWLGREPNPAWPESVKVRYWEEDWWNILEEELNRIQQAGFDGVYLDIVDGFEYWGKEATYEQEPRLAGDPANREEAAERMMDLVIRISDHLRNQEAEYEVFPQNAESILFFDDGSYLDAISGIGLEDTWFRQEEPIDQEERRTRLSYVDQVQEAGKPVLSVDYVRVDSPGLQDNKRINTYYEQCQQQGFSCFAANMDRELDEFVPR